MATKRSANVRSRVYSFSDDSEDDVQRKPVKRQKRNIQKDVYVADGGASKKMTRQTTISPSYDEERFRDVANRNGLKPQFLDKKQSCFSRNAILARENRIKKKMYMSDLENQVASLKSENKKIRTTIGTQSNYITDLEKEINYLKSVLANTKEIGLLLRSVHGNTGLPVTTSMKNCWSKDTEFKEKNLPISPPQKAKPWTSIREENKIAKINSNRHIPTPPTSISSMSPCHQYSPISEPSSPLHLDITSYLSDDDFSFDDIALPQFSSIDDDVFASIPLEKDEPASVESPYLKLHDNTVTDHTYSSSLNMFPDFKPVNVGVCLHISNQKVSLEFCSKCNEKAALNWEH